MKKTVLILLFIFISASCSLFGRLNITGHWEGTATNSSSGTAQLHMTFVQINNDLSGTFSSVLARNAGDLLGTISGHSIHVTLESGNHDYSATMNGTVASGGEQMSGSGNDQYGSFTFQLRKVS